MKPTQSYRRMTYWQSYADIERAGQHIKRAFNPTDSKYDLADTLLLANQNQSADSSRLASHKTATKSNRKCIKAFPLFGEELSADDSACDDWSAPLDDEPKAEPRVCMPPLQGGDMVFHRPLPPALPDCLHAPDAYRCLSPAITLLIMPTLLEIIAQK